MNTNEEMNKRIIELLNQSEEPLKLHAAKRIEELEIENQHLKTDLALEKKADEEIQEILKKYTDDWEHWRRQTKHDGVSAH